MKLRQHYGDLTPSQEKAVTDLDKFLASPVPCFVLRGYAGTGKTFLLEGLTRHLEVHKLPFVLLSPTGRAARIMQTKTNHPASTVHSHIYTMDGSSLEAKANDLLSGFKNGLAPAGFQRSKTEQYNKRQKIGFLLKDRPEEEKKCIYIVDETSLISDTNDTGSLLDFGSGKLLSDLLRYIRADGKQRKVIFIGDPAQLPPVNAVFSPCLNPEYLLSRHFPLVSYAELTDIKRQSSGGILANATALRQKIDKKVFPTPPTITLGNPDLQYLKIEEEWISQYYKRLKSRSFDENIMITFSNDRVHYLNSVVRKKLFPGTGVLRVGDRLIVQQNNHAYDLINGDMLDVVAIMDESKQIGSVSLRKVKVSTQSRREIETWVVESLLYGSESALLPDQEDGLLLQFHQRMLSSKIYPKDQEYGRLMMNDPILNALRCKFGYAITCHKAQGGEWHSVFLDMDRKLYRLTKSEPEALYRWIYTGLTRAQKELFILNDFILNVSQSGFGKSSRLSTFEFID